MAWAIVYLMFIAVVLVFMVGSSLEGRRQLALAGRDLKGVCSVCREEFYLRSLSRIKLKGEQGMRNCCMECSQGIPEEEFEKGPFTLLLQSQ